MEATHHHDADAEAPVVPGYSGDKAALLARLRRVEGQVRGVQRMVDEDTYCIEVLTQISAATRALQAVAVGLPGGAVTVTSNAPLDRGSVAAAVDEAGYVLAAAG